MNTKNTYSEEFSEIASRIPDSYTSFIIWGLTIFMGILILLGIAIKIPETVVAEVRVTSTQPPTILKAQNSGNLQLIKQFPKLYKQGEYLAIIENAADYNHVYHLKQILNKMNIFDNSQIDSILAYQILFLGDIEMPFYEFKEILQKYRLFQNNTNDYKHEISLLQQNIKSDIEALNHQKKMLQLNMQYHVVKEKQYLTDSLLYNESAILEKEIDNSYTNYLTSLQQITSTSSSIQNINQSINQSKLKIINLREEYTNTLEETKLQLNKAYHNLLSNIKNWEKSFVFITPQDGMVELANILSNVSFVNIGDPIFNVIYSNNSYYGIAVLPAEGAGEVSVGQNVNLKIDLYPYQEYGVLEGKISSISLSSIEKNYLVYINIPNGLISATKKELTFAETMYGTAEIITNKKRLISKVFSKITDLFNMNKKASIKQETEQKIKNDHDIQF